LDPQNGSFSLAKAAGDGRIVELHEPCNDLGVPFPGE
jgi:hypothetical protein